jgi:poly(A) polymerase Pap1
MSKQHDSIMLVLDKLMKVAHFILVKTTHKATNIENIYMKEVSRLHEVPKEIFLNKDPKFTSNFWKDFFKGFGTYLNLSTTYHPESDGRKKRTNKIIEDMLRMYVMYNPSKWEDYIHLVDIAYNNGYQSSLKMSPSEALHGRKCNTLVSWDKPRNRAIIGPYLL